MAEDAPAQAEDRGAVPLDEQLEGGLLMLGGEPMEQLPVGGFAVTRQLANMPQD